MRRRLSAEDMTMNPVVLLLQDVPDSNSAVNELFGVTSLKDYPVSWMNSVQDSTKTGTVP
ncbi:hypothetical protein RGQ30_23300 [Limnobacter thiooxidans]|uniref:Uncharacterized protein n=1 Tax=Limnobacter thiooxidans TaxID=131080 RepID=A0AA86J417_9BURK|nr:hypothetical protein RGQ30_23300 [Limnobacter thiooxidans]